VVKKDSYLTINIKLFTLLALIFIGYGQPRTALEVIDSLTLNIIEEQLSNITHNAEDSIAIDITALSSEKGEYLYTILGNLFIEKEWVVYRNFNQTRAFQGKVLKLSRFQVNMWYAVENSVHNDILRNSYVGIKGQLFNGLSGRILKTFSGERLYRDYIDRQQFEDEGNKLDSYIIEQRQNLTLWDKMIEPALIITTAAVIVYLFFSQRF
jgi:hypothetical protein